MSRTKQWNYEMILEHTLLDVSSGCRIWQRDKTCGYARLETDGTRWRVNRFVYQLFHGPIPDNLFVRHTCHKPACVNIDHLLLGTPLDNTNDMLRAQRHQFGSQRANAKLTESIVEDIKRRLHAGELGKDLASEYGVPRPLISKIKNGKRWRHVG